MQNDILKHYGVLGMKWGHRKARNSKSSSPRDPRSMTDKELNTYIKEARLREAKNVRSMDDYELNKKVNRLRAEKQLRELTYEDVSPGKAAAKRILSSSGQKVLGTLATGAMLYGTKALLTGEFNPKELAGYMTPKPKK